MSININNYEAFVLDYLEGSISAHDKEALLQFMELHPELKADLDTDVSLGLNDDSTRPIFSFKNELLKHEANAYDMPLLDYHIIKKQEEGLTKNEEAELLLVEPDAQKREQSSKHYAQTILKSDIEVIYSEKAKIRRFKLLPFVKQQSFNRVASIAAIVAACASIWLMFDMPDQTTPKIANNTTSNAVNTSTLAEAKILEKTLPGDTQPSKDSLLNLAKDPLQLKKKPVVAKKTTEKKNAEYLASIHHIDRFSIASINAYEHGLNVMMPQYMTNNLLREELATIYRKIEDEQTTPSLTLAVLESGVKVMNFLSKESVKMQKYYNDNGEVVAYKLQGDNLEVNRKIKQ
ncbi:hypothetical protein [Carboxylicivirga marina]|uniref:Uncharacterized protein n=1 Tax=Carboxylicivirga marina TaxID=2800988 RepID=A0ABS1HG05_9BACT|nr:hypothetical protein [Carboxylicivirga marina]MBK3516541.1 hypothetical protein [Carboxylicivirga marina]